MIIYKITNKINGKIYIGQTIYTIEHRISGHLHSKDSTRFHNALRKYGIENFSIEVIDNAFTQEELNEKEIFWIKEYDSMNPNVGYNSTPGGDANPMNSKEIKDAHDKKMRTEEVRNKISKSLKEYRINNEFSEEHRKNISNSMLGNKNFFGHKRSQESIDKTSRALQKGVYCVDKLGNKVNEFDSIKSACEWLNSINCTNYTYKQLHKKIRKSCVSDSFVDDLKWYYK